MRTLAPRNPKQTKENHKNLTVLTWYCLKLRYEAGESKTRNLAIQTYGSYWKATKLTCADWMWEIPWMVELSRNSLTTSMPGLLASAQEDIKKKGCSWQMNQNIFLGNNTMRPNLSSGANMNHFHLAQWINHESAPLYNIFVSVTIVLERRGFFCTNTSYRAVHTQDLKL